MAFIDELKIYAEAGKGGDGVVRWRREKFIDKGGPVGGDGGRGGDVYAEAVRDIYALTEYRNQKEFFAEQGDPGGARSAHGKDGEKLVLKLPVGTVITNLDTGERYELVEQGQKLLLLRGGAGGYGNEHFKSSTNQSPQEALAGRPGETGHFHIELQLFADAGFIGLPNAGKSSLLNALTNASSKIGDYQFTTLDPSLGAFYGFVLADIPGLIEGANKGKGLGHKFLRHIKRTRLLVHLVSFENENMIETYETIRKELAAYDEELTQKAEIILLTKTDVTTPDRIKEMKTAFQKYGKQVYEITLFNDAEIKEFGDELIKFLRN